MLDSIRKKKENFFYSLIILVTAGVMLLFGTSRMGDDGNRSGGPAVFVNGQIVTMREYQQAVENLYMRYAAMLGNQYDEKLLKALNVEKSALDQLIQQKLLEQQAVELKIAIPNKELEDYIKSLPYFQKDGKFDYEAYKKIPNPGDREREIRTELQRTRLTSYLADRIRLTPAEIKRQYLLKKSMAEVQYAKIDFKNLAPASTTKDVTGYLEKNAAEIQQYYDSHAEDYTDKASAQIRQIRIGVPFQATDAQKGEAKKKIEAIAKEATPENFETVAKAKSDDEYAKKGGLVGWVTRGSLEKPLEDALDKLALKQVSSVVETPFGYYLIQLLEKKEAAKKPFEQVKLLIAEKLASKKAKDSWAEDKRKTFDDILAKGGDLERELKALKVNLQKTGTFSLGQGYLPNIGQDDLMMDAVFELTKEKPFAKKLFFHQDAYYYLKLVSLEKAKESDFEKEREGIEKNMISDLQNSLIRQWLDELQKKAKIKYELRLDKPQALES